jgi:hypothetical protein
VRGVRFIYTFIIHVFESKLRISFPSLKQEFESLLDYHSPVDRAGFKFSVSVNEDFRRTFVDLKT